MSKLKKRFSIRVVIAGFFTIVFCILTCWNETQAEPASVGTVKQIKSGTLDREEGNATWNPLPQNSTIHPYDRLRTGPDSVVVLSLTNVGVVLMKSDTEYTVGSDPMNFKTILHRGYIWIKTALMHGARLDISASGAVAGVRGTRVSVLSDEQGVDICTCTGKVRVTSKTGKIMTVDGGMYGAIGKDGIAEAPKQSKPILEKLWKGETSRFTSCKYCHQKGKKGKANL